MWHRMDQHHLRIEVNTVAVAGTRTAGLESMAGIHIADSHQEAYFAGNHPVLTVALVGKRLPAPSADPQ